MKLGPGPDLMTLLTNNWRLCKQEMIRNMSSVLHGLAKKCFWLLRAYSTLLDILRLHSKQRMGIISAELGGKQIKAMKFGQALILDHDKTSP